MNRYAVAMNLIKPLLTGGESISIRLEIVEANSIEEAFGKVILAVKSGDYRIGAYRAIEIDQKVEE